jgi:hypothetical protein
MKQVLNRVRIALNLASMKDDELLKLVVSIGSLAPASALIAIPAVATAVTSLGAKGATFKSARDTVTADLDKLANDRSAQAAARGALENDVNALAGLVATNAKSAADVASMAFVERGVAKVTVPEPGRFVAQQSPDPIGPTTWSPLPGTGKSRTVTGVSGTKVWVRFARVRAQLQSDWSTPVLVTIP